MKINELKTRKEILEDTRSKETFFQFEKLLSELRKKELPDEIVSYINNNVEEINSITE